MALILPTSSRGASELQSVLAGHHQVEHDEIDVRLLQRATHGFAIGHGGGAVAILLQVIAEQRANVAVVVDDQDMTGFAHDRSNDGQWRLPGL
jgi:hypothetical protein